MGGMAAMDLEHDASAPAAGSRASHAAAAAARPTQPRALPLVSPEAHDRVSCGTGWGHVPRPITECCVAEQGSIDDLVLRVQHHDRTCNAPLCRVHDANAAQWGCHSVGLVNVCRFVCSSGCVINWSSAKPLPGPPAQQQGGTGSAILIDARPDAGTEMQ